MMPHPTEINVDALAAKLAGVAGAIVSMKFLQGTLLQRVFTAFAGALMSYYTTPHISERIGMPEGLTGFLIGLFGMAIASRGWEWVQTTPVAALWQILLDWLTRKSGGSK